MNGSMYTPHACKLDELADAHLVHPLAGYEGGNGNVNSTDLIESLGGRVVVASTNYRLNVYGFLGGNELRTRDPGESGARLTRSVCSGWW
jgi:hypothetical protein